MTAVIAHRGASRAARENTIEAFRAASTMRADAVELDVRRTRDGMLVVHHNPALDDERVIAECLAGDLPAHVPALSDALDACAGMWVNVEIKNDRSEPDFDAVDSIADETVALLVSRDEHERWLISSFRAETIERCRQIADRRRLPIRTALLTTFVPDGMIQQLIDRGHSAVHPSVHLLGRDVVDSCRRAGLQVNTWTCDDPVRMRELVDWGIDGICTNVPDVALKVVAGRGG